MRQYYIYKPCEHANHHVRHYDHDVAMQIVDDISYTNRQGMKHQGAHWTSEECQQYASSMGLSFPAGTTEWDVYVAFNSFYADTNKVLSDTDIIRAAHSFYFADEDAPDMKLQHYMLAMHD